MVKKLLAIMILVGVLLATPIALAKNDGQGNGAQLKHLNAAENGLSKGQGMAKHLYLYQKNSTDWSIVPDGAWGKMNFKQAGLVFNGHGLEPGQNFTLIYYPDPWPGTGLIDLGNATADKNGNVHIKATFDFLSIPIVGDTNAGAKIWLVLTDDLQLGDTSSMIAWNPDCYLFEYVTITPSTLWILK